MQNEELARAATGLRRLADADTPALTAPEDRMERVRHRVVRARRRRTAVVAAPVVVALVAGAVSLATGPRDGRPAGPGGTTPATTPGPDRTATPRKVLRMPDVAGGMNMRVSVPGDWRVPEPRRVDGADVTDAPASETYVLAGPAAHETSSTAASTVSGTPVRAPSSVAPTGTVAPADGGAPTGNGDSGDSACVDSLKEALYGPELCLPVTRLPKNSALVLWRRESYDRPGKNLPVQRSMPTPVCRELGGTAFLTRRQPLPGHPDSTVAAYACLASADPALVERVEDALTSARFS